VQGFYPAGIALFARGAIATIRKINTASGGMRNSA
jgi:hypothetical protein